MADNVVLTKDIKDLSAKEASQLAFKTIRDFVTEWRQAMATLKEDLDRYFADVDTEFQQIRDGLQETITRLEGENADLKSEVSSLTDLRDQVTDAQTRLGEKSAALEVNDPA